MYSGTNGEVVPTRAGRYYGFACPAGVYRCGDQYIVVMGMLHHWPDLCRAMGREDLIDDPELGNDRSRVKRRDDVTKMLEDWLAQFPDVDAAVAELERFDVPWAPVLSIAEATQHPQLRERGTVQAIDDPVHGPVEIPAMPIRWGEHPSRPPVDSPTLGQHDRKVLADILGRSEADLEALRDAGVLLEKEV